MTDSDKDLTDMFKRVEKTEETETDILERAVVDGSMADINDATRLLETLHEKRNQAVELGLSGSKQSIDERLEQAEKDLEHLRQTVDHPTARKRAAVLKALADGSNVGDASEFAEKGAVETNTGPNTDAAGNVSLSDSSPQERERKVSRLQESTEEAENMGFSKAAKHYRDKISMIRKGR